MKNIFNQLFLFVFLGLMITACGEEERQVLTDEFVGLDKSATSFTYESFGDGQSVNGGFRAALIAQAQTSDVNFTFEIVADSSSAIESLHYTVDGTTGTIPAGEYYGSMPINVIPDNIDIGEVLTLYIRITGGGNLPIAVNFQEQRFSFDATCPLDASKYLGDYRLNYQVAQFPFGVETFGTDGRTITLEPVTGAASKRQFSFVYLEAGGFGNGPVNFRFNLICGDVIPDSEQGMGLFCTPGFDITIGPAPINSSFDANDDSVLDIAFEEFVTDGDCQVPPVTQTIRLTKL